jgi:hypothetical protein
MIEEYDRVNGMDGQIEARERASKRGEYPHSESPPCSNMEEEQLWNAGESCSDQAYLEVVGEENSAVGPPPPPDKEARGAEVVGEENSAAGPPPPPPDKEASAIVGQQGGEGLEGCGRRELCCGAIAGKKNPWLSNLPHTGRRAL